MKNLSQPINFEYRSKREINGWPIIHINLGTHPEPGRTLIAKGIVAIGNIAFGIVSIGAVAFGIVTLAGVGLGILSLAGIAIGIVALGAIAFGYQVSLGAIVQSSEVAFGAITLDAPFFEWSLLFAAGIALLIWALDKVKAVKL